MLLLAGADPNHVTSILERCPLLGVFSHLGNREMVHLLLDYCADVNGANSLGRTALSLAAAGGHEEVVQLLLQAGAQVKGQEGRGPRTHLGIQVNRVDKEEQCALVVAAREGHRLVVELLCGQVKSARYGVRCGLCVAVP